MFLEVLGLARRQLMIVVLPCLLSSGVGALLFTGLGRWTGFEIGSLAIPDLTPLRLTAAAVAWTIPLAILVAVGTWLVYLVGHRTAARAATHLMRTTVAAGVIAGAAACVYALVTDRSPAEVVLSGQATLGPLASNPRRLDDRRARRPAAGQGDRLRRVPGHLPRRAGVSRPVPGSVVGVLAATLLPGLDVLPAIAIGMAAGMAVTGLPVTSVVLVTLLLGDAAASQMPIVILAVVVALVTEGLLSHGPATRGLRNAAHRQRSSP
ncbi:hypothetical protein [Aeromicrobium sp. UC242_57]|uniref:hypothetical protein n=1 Tax=Aeromicrobium sp. UC242_57 TaxID=3374624 RepID=UPI003793B8BD